MHGIAVAAEHAGFRRHVIGDDPVAAFVREFFLGMRRSTCSVSAAKPITSAGRLPARFATVARMSGFSVSASGGALPPLFLIFCVLRLRDAPVGDGGGEDRDVGGQRLLHRRQHLLRGFHLDDASRRQDRAAPPARSPASRPRPRGRRGRGNRVALLAGGTVADEAHRIDRLMRRAGGDDHALAGERARGFRLRQQALRRRRRSPAAPPCGRRRASPRSAISPSFGPTQRDAVGWQAARGCAASRRCSTCAGSSPAPAGSSCRWRAARRWRDRRHGRRASFAIRSAVAGATTIRSASRDRRICPTSNSLSRIEQVGENLARRRSRRPTSGVTNFCAALVITTRTASRARAGGGSGRAIYRRRCRRR